MNELFKRMGFKASTTDKKNMATTYEDGGSS